MGLLCEFTPEDLGFPRTVSFSYLTEEVDYTRACEVFVKNFEAVATQLVPVDTGFLRSTLHAEYVPNDYVCSAYTECEYAQYVEYGTWKQAAQPYFEPAIAMALGDFYQMADQAVEAAKQNIQDEWNSMINPLMGVLDQMGIPLGTGGIFNPGLLFLLAILAPLYLIMLEIFTSVSEKSIRRGMDFINSGAVAIQII